MLGKPNLLSREHHPWPIIDQVSHACAKPSPTHYDPAAARELPGIAPSHAAQAPDQDPAWLDMQRAQRQASAGRLIRQRRNAVAMDGRTHLWATDFYLMLACTLPSAGHPVWRGWPWPASI